MIIIRIWHQSLIPHLPRQQLLGQHRECAALRGAGWGRPHATVNYVFKYDPAFLVAYHYLIMEEMRKRGYNPDSIWMNVNWRGKTLGEQKDWVNSATVTDLLMAVIGGGANLFLEHNDEYLQECLDNLKGKGIIIEV